MKSRTLVSILILITSILFIFAGKKEPSEEICETWVNTDYNKLFDFYEKLVLNTDGTYALYNKESSAKPSYTGTYSITDKWTDDEGSIWYKIFNVEGEASNTFYDLVRISDSGRIYEVMTYKTDYPTEINPKSVAYRIYYRQ